MPKATRNHPNIKRVWKFARRMLNKGLEIDEVVDLMNRDFKKSSGGLYKRNDVTVFINRYPYPLHGYLKAQRAKLKAVAQRSVPEQTEMAIDIQVDRKNAMRIVSEAEEIHKRNALVARVIGSTVSESQKTKMMIDILNGKSVSTIQYECAVIDDILCLTSVDLLTLVSRSCELTKDQAKMICDNLKLVHNFALSSAAIEKDTANG